MRSALEAKEKDLRALEEMLTARERVSYNTRISPCLVDNAKMLYVLD